MIGLMIPQSSDFWSTCLYQLIYRGWFVEAVTIQMSDKVHLRRFRFWFSWVAVFGRRGEMCVMKAICGVTVFSYRFIFRGFLRVPLFISLYFLTFLLSGQTEDKQGHCAHEENKRWVSCDLREAPWNILLWNITIRCSCVICSTVNSTHTISCF